MKKHRFKKISASFILIISLMLGMFSTPISVYADPLDSSAYDKDKDAAKGRYPGGPSHAKTGWLVYVMDEDSNSRISPSTVFYYCYFEPPIPPVGNLTTRNGIGGVCDEAKGQIPSYIGEPFTGENNARGMEVKLWLVSEDPQYGAGAYRFMEDTWGAGFVENLQANYENWVLIMEPVYWHNVYVLGTNTNVPFVGTAFTLGIFQSRLLALQPQGDSAIGSMTNGIYGTCAMVEPNAKFGIESPRNTGRITNDELIAYGYGMLQVWPNDPMTHTWDQINCGSIPGAAPERPKGIVNITKSYHTVNRSTGEDTHDGCFIRKDTSIKILIEDEPEYKVEKWKVTDSEPVEVDGTEAGWNPPGSPQETGDKPGTTKVVPPGKTLFVQLIKEEEEEEEKLDDIDYYINESQISKHVTISEAEVNEDAMTIKEKEFNWKWPELQEECSGHSYITREFVPEHDDDDDDETPEGRWEDVEHTDYCSGWIISDKEVTLMLQNSAWDDWHEILSDTWREIPMVDGQESTLYHHAEILEVCICM